MKSFDVWVENKTAYTTTNRRHLFRVYAPTLLQAVDRVAAAAPPGTTILNARETPGKTYTTVLVAR